MNVRLELAGKIIVAEKYTVEKNLKAGQANSKYLFRQQWDSACCASAFGTRLLQVRKKYIRFWSKIPP